MPHMVLVRSNSRSKRTPEIVLDDRFGQSCHQEIYQQVQLIFKTAGFQVARNVPFAGAYLARRHSKPTHGQHVLQIEIDHALYLEEETLKLRSNFANFCGIM